MTADRIRPVGVLGTGAIGLRVVEALAASGLTVRSYDLDEAACRRARTAGATPVGSVRELGDELTLALVSLPGAAQLTDALLGPQGLLPALRPGAVIVDTSTISPVAARAAAVACSVADVAYLDAPVSGRPPDMTAFVGGDPGALGRVRPVLALVAREIHYMGPSGSGAVAKVVNQLLMLVNLVVAAEGILLGQAHGVEPERLARALQDGSGASFALDLVRRHVVHADFSGNDSPLSLMRKDIDLIDELWGRPDVPLWDDARDRYLDAMRRFDAADDFWSVAKVVTEELGAISTTSSSVTPHQ
jgi:3-hydroxyisobutyrate dehydrogenase-like beta-hydroxyacid dehydrogenase